MISMMFRLVIHFSIDVSFSLFVLIYQPRINLEIFYLSFDCCFEELQSINKNTWKQGMIIICFLVLVYGFLDYICIRV